MEEVTIYAEGMVIYRASGHFIAPDGTVTPLDFDVYDQRDIDAVRQAREELGKAGSP